MSLFGTGRREGVGAVVVLLLLVLCARAPSLWTVPTDGGAVHRGPHSSAVSEAEVTAHITLPALAAAGEVWRDGEFPQWNPHHRLGEPFALSGAPVYYPPFWPLMLENGARWLPWILALHGFIAAMGMYRFLRAQPLSRFSAFAGGGFFGLGWFLATQEGRLPEMAAAAWIPLALEAAWRVLTTRQRDPWGCLLAATVAIPFLTGGFAMALVGLGAAAAMVVTHVSLLERSERGHTGRTLGVAVVLAAGLTCPLWLDALALWHAVAPAAPVQPQLTWAGLVGVLSPGMGDAVEASGPLRHLAPAADPTELALFPGVAVGFLILLGLLRGKPGVGTFYWGIVAALGLLCTVEGPVANWIHQLLAPLGMVPGAFLLWFHLGLTVVAAQSLDNFLDNPMRRPHAVTAAIAVSVAAILLLGALPQLVDWAGASSPDLDHLWQTGTMPLVSTGAAVVLLGLLFCTWRRLGILRFKNVLATAFMGELLILGWIHQEARPLGTTTAPTVATQRVAMGTGRVALAGVDGSISAQGTPLHRPGIGMLQSTADLLRLIDPQMLRSGPRSAIRPLASASQLEHPLLEIAAVNTGLTPTAHYSNRFATPTARPGGAAVAVGDRHGSPTAVATSRLWPAPRAHVVFDTEVAATPEAAAAGLVAGAEHLSRRAVVELPKGATPPPTADAATPRQPARMHWLRDGAGQIDLRVTTRGDDPGLLVLADAWAPGWTATVDGEPTPVLRTNVGCRGVVVPPGDRQVSFRYAPPSATIGPWALGGAALLLLLWSLGCAVGVIRAPRFR